MRVGKTPGGVCWVAYASSRNPPHLAHELNITPNPHPTTAMQSIARTASVCAPVARTAAPAAAPAKAFFGSAKALRSQAVTIRSRTARQVVTMAVRADPSVLPIACGEDACGQAGFARSAVAGQCRSSWQVGWVWPVGGEEGPGERGGRAGKAFRDDTGAAAVWRLRSERNPLSWGDAFAPLRGPRLRSLTAKAVQGGYVGDVGWL